jgi:hypothetical protein
MFTITPTDPLVVPEVDEWNTVVHRQQYLYPPGTRVYTIFVSRKNPVHPELKVPWEEGPRYWASPFPEEEVEEQGVSYVDENVSLPIRRNPRLMFKATDETLDQRLEFLRGIPNIVIQEPPDSYVVQQKVCQVGIDTNINDALVCLCNRNEDSAVYRKATCLIQNLKDPYDATTLEPSGFTCPGVFRVADAYWGFENVKTLKVGQKSVDLDQFTESSPLVAGAIPYLQIRVKVQDPLKPITFMYALYGVKIRESFGELDSIKYPHGLKVAK